MSRQQASLFDLSPPAWEADDADERLVATIVFPTGAPREYDYLVPDSLRDDIEVGRRLRVPLGGRDRQTLGYCVRVEYRPVGSRALKSVGSVVDERRLLSPSLVRLSRWIADHYLCPWGQVLDAMVPVGVRDSAGTRLMTLLRVPPEVIAKLAELKLPDRQKQVLQVLATSNGPLTAVQLAARAKCTVSPITSLRRKGLISSETRRLRSNDFVETQTPIEDDHVLNPHQQKAFDAIRSALQAGRPETILLHGITGSGKTEVYIRAIQDVVSFGRQAIVLVPEISLTPQAQQRFRARFGSVAVLHSHQSDTERHAEWSRIAGGDVRVVVGARSAIFAPVPHLGLIVLDEEHEATFKQDSAPRYHAREVALRRAADEGVPLVLGSATPSLESWQRAQNGTYRLIELPHRVHGRPLPDVLTIDLRQDSRSTAFRGAISRQLYSAMNTALGEGGQVILLLNRRGFSTHIQCSACGAAVRCPHCDLALTHHRQAQIALCHYCDYEIPAPRECPECHAPGIDYRGLGTQRLEDEVKARFAQYRVLRMDTDTMRQHGSHERALTAFRDGEVQILVGTQMIAKGLDFPNVTLVGVVLADTALHLPDFRASERTFQLLVQVAGRTGRGPKGGRVLVQTFSPEHPAIQAAVRHDYTAFADYELPTRQQLTYPPFAAMARFVVRGESEITTRETATALAQRLTEALTARHVDARVLGPAPAPLAKLRGKYRFQIQTQGLDAEGLHASIVAAASDFRTVDEVQWIVDIDPLEML